MTGLHHTSRPVRRSQWSGYALAAALTVFTLLVRVLIGHRMDVPNLILFIVPIILSAYWGGFRPGLLATLLAVLGSAYYVLLPQHSFMVASNTQRIQLLLLFLSGALISLICEMFHREQDRVETLLAERERHQGELAQLAAIVQSSEDAIIGKTLDGVVTSWNAGAEALFGYSAQEMIGQPITRLIAPERLVEEDEILARVRRGESMRHLDTVRVRKDGSSVDVSITTSAIKDPLGRIIGASKIARDITEVRRNVAALRASEARTHLATEATAVGIWEWALETDQIRWDAQMFRLYGLPETANGLVPYDTWMAAVLEEDRPGVQGGLKDSIRRLGRGSRTFRIRRHGDQAVRYLEAAETVRTNSRGQAEWMVGTALDVTDRRQMEQEVRDSEARFRTMANSISQLAWIARPDGYIFWYNRRWYEYTGTTPEQMQGWGWQSVHDPTVLPDVMAGWEESIATGSAFEMEFPLRSADGTFRAFLTRVIPLKNSADEVVQWFGTNTDVEAIKRAETEALHLNTELEQRLLLRNAELEAANKELESFSYSVSHDLRSPLRAMDAYSLTLLGEFGPQLPAEAQTLLLEIRAGSRRMADLIDDLLALAKLNRQPLRKQALRMEPLVHSTLEPLMADCGGRKLQVTVGTMPTCYGDPALLKQVWSNLLSNALKYSRKRDHTQVDVGATTSADGIAYFVRDNGTGFDMRYADKLFGVFQRLHRAEDYEGTGVGLAIVQRIVNRHGGRIWAESAEGIGSTFFFTLPEVATS